MKAILNGFRSLLFMIGIILLCSGCGLFFQESIDDDDKKISINGLTLGKSTLSMKVGTLDYVPVRISPSNFQKDVKLKWTYDEKVIACDMESNFGITIRAIAEGQTSLRCSYDGFDATCIITVTGYAEGYEETIEPYIYSNTTIIQTSPGVSEKVFVSLYGGNASDVNDYSWTNENNSVATIQPTGQYCVITAKDTGYTRLKVTHNKASYPYYIGVYVIGDNTKIPFITTSNNILTMNKDDPEQTISCNLVNGQETSHDSNFAWEIVAEENSDIPVRIDYNGNNAVISPVKEGSCTVRITHPDAPYPLDIVCRVITIVKNVYIKPDKTIIYLNGDTEQTITSNLMNINVGEYSIDQYEYRLDNETAAEIVAWSSNQVILKGKANGSCKVIISHPKAAYTREVLCIVTGQQADAVDASCYITTSQNYVRTKVGAEATTINVALKGGSEGDNSGFRWSVSNQADDGISEVVQLETTDGTVESARAASNNYIFGSCHITPKAKGTAVITISHPKVYYSTEILVKVLDSNAVLEEPLYFIGSGLVKILNGEQSEYKVNLKGPNKTENDDNNIRWSIDNSLIKLVPSGSIVNITAPVMGTGCTTSTMTVSHNKSDSDKTVVVMTADDEKTLEEMKALYSDKNYYNLQVGDAVDVLVSAAGFDYSDGEGNTIDYDFSLLNWTTTDSTVISVEKYVKNPLCCKIKALKSGQVTLTASIGEYSYNFKVTVYPEGTVMLEPEVYFTTTQNVVAISNISKSANVKISAINLPASSYSDITWEIQDNTVASIIPNGVNATVTGLKEGETVIKVNHPSSQNELKIYVRVGSEYVMEETESVVYIKADNLITVLVGDEDKKISASLVNFTGPDSSGFTFESLDSSIAEISGQSPNGTAYIKGISKGYTEIKVSHISTKVSKNILVVVGKTNTEITEILEGTEAKGSPYLLSKENTVTFTDLSRSKTVDITAMNVHSSDFSKITWSSKDTSIARVNGNGTNATIHSVAKGMTEITANYPGSLNSVTFYVFVQTEDIVPLPGKTIYIGAPDVITAIKGDKNQQINSYLINAPENEKGSFSFEIDNQKVAEITAQSINGIAYIKPVGSGQAIVTIKNTLTTITKQVLIVVGNSADELAGLTYLSTNTNVVAIGEGNSKTVSVSIKNAQDIIVNGYNWFSSNPNVVDVKATGANAVLVGNSVGTAIITVTNSACKYPLQIIAQCVDPTAANENPFIHLTSSVLTIPVSPSYTNITADLVGGTKSDFSDFTWQTNDSSICMVYGQNEVGKIRAVKAGTTYITVSHPKAKDSAQLLVVCDEPVKSDCYISVPSSIINMKPTDSAQTIQCTLVNGSANDKYNFKWSQDVYDIIDMQYSANVCTITPKTAGSVTITISHPKAAYDQQIIVNVQQYANFAFPQESVTITQGDVKFLNMQVPVTAVSTKVEYSVPEDGKSDKICRATGTNSVVQLTGVGPGTTTVTAILVAASTGVEQARAEMMVYVKPKEVSTVYITSAMTISTVNKGKSQTLNATLTGSGVTATDPQNLKWTTKASDIVQITGINSSGYVQGQSIYVTALKPGEAIITCTHEKAASPLQFFIIVPGTAEKAVTLNKSYMTIVKGSSGNQLKATIENLDNSSDYTKLEWKCENNNGKDEIARVMGSGQTVTIYPVNPGECTVTAKYDKNDKIVAKCTVVVEAAKSFNFEYSTITLAPFETKKVKYTVSPANAIINWTVSQDKDYFEYNPLDVNSSGVGYVEIKGVKVGSGILHCVANETNKGSLQVKVDWDYNFSVSGATNFKIAPNKKQTINYKVNPPDADIEVECTDSDSFESIKYTNGDGTGSVDIIPKKETERNIKIYLKALNKHNNYELIGSQEITAKFEYPEELNVNLKLLNKSGNFSRFENGALYIGDGESVTMDLSFEEKNASGTFTAASFNTSSENTSDVKITDVKLGNTNSFKIVSPNDVTKWVYEIVSATAPCYKDESENDVLIQNWKTDLQWVGRNYEHNDNDYDTIGLKRTCDPWKENIRSKNYAFTYCDWLYAADDDSANSKKLTANPKVTRRELPDEVGKIYTAEEFHKIFWWWCIGSYDISKDMCISPDEIDAELGVYTGYNATGTYDPVTETYTGFKLGQYGAGGGHPSVLQPSIMRDNVTAKHYISTDTSEKQFIYAGNVTVTYSHIDKTKNYSFPVYYEQRYCSKDYK